MTTSENNETEVQNDPRDNMARYSKEIEDDITSARKLLEEYSKVPSDQVIAHIHAVVCLPSIFPPPSALDLPPIPVPSAPSTHQHR